MRFEREQCLDLDAAFARTWILADGFGGLAAGCVLGCPASRHHGLLIAPAGPDGAPHVFLARLEEWLVEGGKALPISSARYPGVVEPSGHTYLASFDAWPQPTWRYLVGDVEVTRTLDLLPPPGHGVVVRWRVKAPRGAARRLRVRPLLACRPAAALTFENPHATTGVEALGDGVRVQPYASLPALSLRMDSGARFVAQSAWHTCYQQVQDLAAGRAGQEDHLSPGVFEVDLARSGAATLVAAIDRRPRERLPRAPSPGAIADAAPPSLAGVLDEAARRHIRLAPAPDQMLTARLPWADADPLATWEALGPLLAWLGEPAALLGLVTGPLGPCGVGGPAPDLGRPDLRVAALAWSRGALAALEARQPATAKRVCLERLFLLGHALREQAGHDTFSARSGLVSGAREPGTARLDVLLNAHWVRLANALARLARGTDKRAGPARQGWSVTARAVARAFRAHFWLEEQGYLADAWVEGEPDRSVRPGMLVAAAEPAVPLSKAERLSIVERARVELLTPRGLRTLSPRDSAYDPDPGARAPQALQRRNGAVEPRWLLPYAQATLLAKGRAAAVKRGLRALVEGFEPHLAEHGLGCVAEVFDGEPPHRASGAPSDVRSVAALLGVLRLAGGRTR